MFTDRFFAFYFILLDYYCKWIYLCTQGLFPDNYSYPAIHSFNYFISISVNLYWVGTSPTVTTLQQRSKCLSLSLLWSYLQRNIAISFIHRKYSTLRHSYMLHCVTAIDLLFWHILLACLCYIPHLSQTGPVLELHTSDPDDIIQVSEGLCMSPMRFDVIDVSVIWFDLRVNSALENLIKVVCTSMLPFYVLFGFWNQPMDFHCMDSWNILQILSFMFHRKEKVIGLKWHEGK